MEYLDLTFPTPAENLAADEALLDAAEFGERGECLRFWQPHSNFVVLGHSNRVNTEVNIQACDSLNIPILRRCSGGGTVLQGPGVLNYALILNFTARPELATVACANRFIMTRHAQLLSSLLSRPVTLLGNTDLTSAGRKISGNAQRRKRHYLLFHGTLLLDPDIELMERLLPLPSRVPGYRANRSHSEFLDRIPLAAPELKTAFRIAWNASDTTLSPPAGLVRSLVASRYDTPAWNRKF